MPDLPDTEKLDLDVADGWLTIWFATPENRNALSDELVGELMETLTRIRDDRSVRGVILRGKGGVFCAGGDLKGFMAALSGGLTHEAAAEMNRRGGELFKMVNETPQIVVALIEGAAIAGGLGLACCADIVAVTKDAKFSLTETQLGITPAQIAPHVVRRIGLTESRRLMLTGARFDGEEAAKLGLANFVVDSGDDLARVAADIQAAVKRCAPAANAVTKEILLAAQSLDADEMITFAADKFASTIVSEEGLEGIKSFVEKRKPSWAV